MTITVDPLLRDHARCCPIRQAGSGSETASTTRTPVKGSHTDGPTARAAALPGTKGPAPLPSAFGDLHNLVYAVRLHYPNGTHRFVGPEPDQPEAEKRRANEERDWAAAGLWAPEVSVVTMSGEEFVDHARRAQACASPTCPIAAAPGELLQRTRRGQIPTGGLPNTG